MRIALLRCRDARSLLAILVFVLGATVWATGTPAAELVMFDEAGCVWCARWDEEVGEAYVHSEEGRIAPLRRVPIAQARRLDIRLASAVTVTPTFVLVDDGAEVGRITGYPGADFFWGMLDALIARLRPALPGPEPLERPIVPGRQAVQSRTIGGGGSLATDASGEWTLRAENPG
ncbi:MAG: thioredoxin family protein [Hyphomicrobiaceae bacterium]